MIPPLLRGHLLLFDSQQPEPYGRRAGVRMLAAAALIEAIRVGGVGAMVDAVSILFALPALLALAWILSRAITGLSARQFGFRPWREWTLVEKSYFLQLVVLANVIFLMAFGEALPGHFDWRVFVPYLAYGFYQELVYRGLLQRVAGILLANVLYTFGPLHWHYYAMPAARAVALFAATFAIGLFFGLVFRRSGNLWLPGVFHAIGNAYIVTVGPV